MANDLVKVGCAVLDDYEKWLLEKTDALITKCGIDASEEAYGGFEAAYYSGEKDVRTKFEKTGDLEAEVAAIGDTVLFIEFGTGVNNRTTAAERKERAEVSPGMLAHGEYGQQKGSNPKGWAYYGTPGNSPNARWVAERSKGDVIRTTGDTAASPMYMAREKIIKDSNKIIKEVFKK